jgi:hypothetical protein
MFVYIASRWVWTALIGFLLTALVSVGVFATPGTADRLRHPQDVGPLVGTLVQSVGLGLALIAGVATVIAWFGHRNRD